MTSALDREAIEEAVGRGADLLKQGRLEQAQKAFRVAHELDPENARVLALLGLSYFRGNQFAEARPIYEDLVEKAGTDASHRLNLGLVYLKLGEADKAISSLEASRALDPSQGRAVSYLGLAYARAGRYAEAYRSFLLAGQNELASEIEGNLTPAERDGIHHQLGRTPHGQIGEDGVLIPRTISQPIAVARTSTPPAGIATPRTMTPPKGIEDRPPVTSQLSHPEIVIEKLASDAPAVPMVPARSGASIVDSSPFGPIPERGGAASPPPGVATVSNDPSVRMTESMQFILPRAPAPAPVPGQSMITAAVSAAEPSAIPRTTARSVTGGTPPRPLSELATDQLIRPEDGDEPFEISPSGSLTIRVADRMLSRLDGVHLLGGDLTFELAMRRARGHQTEQKFDYNGEPLHTVSGKGYMVAVPAGKWTFTSVELDDDILYLREDLVFAFEPSLRWENGNVPGLRGHFPVVQFRGNGALTMRLVRPLVRVKLPSQGVLLIDPTRLAGWIGRVIPRAVVPPNGAPLGTKCIECTGEGVVLIEPAPDPAEVAVTAGSAPARATPPPPPQPASPAPTEQAADAAEPAAEPSSEPSLIDELKGFEDL
ncbi:MAG: tetratricopeptide repeat protein [Kofleriaceae bacterium]